ncbi:hypothetical protein ACFLRI_01860 [Bacteroidota bacterium]
MKKVILSKPKQLQVFKLMPVLVISLLSVILGVIVSCSNNTSDSYTVVKFSGDAELLNISRSSNTIFYYSTDSFSTAMIIGEGDLVNIGDFMYYFNKPNETDYDLICNDSLLFINGQLISVKISERYNMLPFLEQLEKSDIMNLKTLHFGQKIPAEYMPVIKEFASINPEIGLFFGKVNEETASILNEFNPLWLGFEEIEENDFALLSGLNNTELLFLSLHDSIVTNTLPKMPGLKHLVLSGENNEIGKEFLANNSHIESIAGYNSIFPDYSFFAELTNLKALSFSWFDTISDMEFINQFPQLESLSMSVEKPRKFDPLNNLNSLRWLSMASDMTQSDFNTIIENHSTLEVVELLECKNVKNLEILAQLDKLMGLTIGDTLSDRSTPLKLNKLKYLSLPNEVYKDSTYLVSLHSALPECTIVPNESIIAGGCLGSGWLLLFFPLVILFGVRWRKLRFFIKA